MKPAAEKIINHYCEKYGFIQMERESLLRCVSILIACYAGGGKLLICGNGGSCADADHIVGELIKTFRIPRPLNDTLRTSLTEQPEGAMLAEKLQQGLPAINLGAQTALMTAMINDVGGEYIFAQQVIAYGKPGDVLMGISTSGNSKDVLYAGSAARAHGMCLIGLTGRKGGRMAESFDVVLHAQADSTEDIQDQHSTFYHAICAALECEFWG